MKKLCLDCTAENLLEAYRHDSLGRNSYLLRFISVLDRLEGGSIIALDGAWGSGKTFFSKQVKYVLDSHNAYWEDKDGNLPFPLDDFRKISLSSCPVQPHFCVYFDAWKHDHDGDPFLSLIYDIYHGVRHEYSLSEVKSTDELLKILLDFDFPLPKELKFFVKLKLFFGSSTTNYGIFDEIDKKKNLDKKIHGFLDSILPEKGDRLVIFIDELDRCNPEFAVRLLERIKHYFIHERITFVLSVDTAQLQATVKHHYGSDFCAASYLDRFFDLRFTLPPVDPKTYIKYLGFDPHGYSHITEIMRYFHFEMREITRYMQLLQIAQPYEQYKLLEDKKTPRKTHALLHRFFVPFMIGLHLHDTAQYRKFVSGDLPDILSTVFDKAVAVRYLSGYLFDDSELNNVTFDDVSRKLREIYHALFGKTTLVSEINLGLIVIRQEDRQALHEISSLLSSESVLGNK